MKMNLVSPTIRALPILVALVLLGGCSEDSKRVIRVTTQLSGASPHEVMETLVLRIEFQLIGLPGVDSITSISSIGSLETYVLVAQEGDIDEMITRVEEELSNAELPFAATAPTVEPLPSTTSIPAVSPTDIYCIVVDLDLEAIARYGISHSKVVSAMQEQAGGSASDMSRLKSLRAIHFSNIGNRTVSLEELAEIRVEKQPSHVVTRWPTED
ncbi:MAG: efflux RND transporter permease subunit [Verrucomicrobia bacterium]|nr:efflux RND transporter permease subunit [Verrucomicrobiota bacterium]MDA1005518.1 efflux RND transporter permease subunit [Verrucomicrobiota bacterium]